MKIIIDIPECFYEYCKSQKDATEIQLAVAKGKPLPKGHGRLIDADSINFSCFFDAGDYAYAMRGIHEAPTIIEAESEDKE